MHGVFLDRASLDRGDIDFAPLHRALSSWRFYDETPAELTAERIRDAGVVISNKAMLDEPALREASALRLICISATGVNNVDLDAARARGIAVCNVRGYATPSVAEHVFALMLMLARNLPRYIQAVRGGAWELGAHFCLLDFPIGELRGKTLGIVGYGELGQAVARIAEAFGMRVLIAEHIDAAPRPGRLPLRELLPQVDVLTLHCPLTPQTRHLIGAAELRSMKRGALLINTARGGIVDEEALAQALREGQLGGAGVDVLTGEPPIDGNPLLAPDIPNLIVTPHIAWASREARQRLLEEVAANIESFLRGTPRNAVE